MSGVPRGVRGKGQRVEGAEGQGREGRARGKQGSHSISQSLVQEQGNGRSQPTIVPARHRQLE